MTHPTFTNPLAIIVTVLLGAVLWSVLIWLVPAVGGVLVALLALGVLWIVADEVKRYGRRS